MPLTLQCHPDFRTPTVTAVDVQVDYLGSGHCSFRYQVSGAISDILLPEPSVPTRTDRLWDTTCFEAFVAARESPEYVELNLSPSRQWAVYAFADYRGDSTNPALISAPKIETDACAETFELVATVDMRGLKKMRAASLDIALAAVIEEKNGRKSFWALNHPLGRPDFHDRGCFIHKLEVTGS